MAGDKKHLRKSSKVQAEAGAIALPSTVTLLDCERVPVQNGEQPAWSLLTVKPKLVPMFANPPESGIGKRIAYCRGQLDNLQVEALARYTKNFDEAGISRTTIVRYESGENTPGGRELRILCDALWIPPNWLLMGQMAGEGVDADELELGRLIGRFVRAKSGGTKGMDDGWHELAERKEVERRQKLIAEARKPQPKA